MSNNSDSVEYEAGQKWRVLETNRIFKGRVGTVVSIELSESSAKGMQYPERLNSEDISDGALVRLGLDIDTTGWAFGRSRTPYFTLRELERVEE